MIRKLSLLLSLAFLGVASGAEKAATLNVSDLKADEKMVVSFRSSGCFHAFHKIYVIEGGAEKPFEASDLLEKWNQETRKIEIVGTKPKGRITLTREESSGLDALLEFYRSKPGGGCTTVETINVVYWRAGEKIGEESFVDGSCSRGQIAGAISLQTVEARIGK